MSQQLPDSDLILAILSKLRPILRDAIVVIEQATGFSKRHGHSCRPLRSRGDENHCSLFPRCTCCPVPDPAPQVDRFFPTVVNATGGSKLIAVLEVLCECFLHSFKSWLNQTCY